MDPYLLHHFHPGSQVYQCYSGSFPQINQIDGKINRNIDRWIDSQILTCFITAILAVRYTIVSQVPFHRQIRQMDRKILTCFITSILAVRYTIVSEVPLDTPTIITSDSCKYHSSNQQFLINKKKYIKDLIRNIFIKLFNS